MFIKYLNAIQNWLLPTACILCGSLARRSLDLCIACEQELPWLNNACSRCALPLTAGEGQLCGNCLRQLPPFVLTLSLFNYQKPIDQLITGLKFHHQLVYARVLGELFADHLVKKWYQGDILPQCIIPVPLHPQRLRERGYNQAVELARPIAKRFNISIDFRSCRRIRATPAQTNLSAIQRYQNIKNAFVVKPMPHVKHIAVFDDVVTTGHTVTELCGVLIKAGVERIDVWCCARTNISKN